MLPRPPGVVAPIATVAPAAPRRPRASRAASAARSGSASRAPAVIVRIRMIATHSSVRETLDNDLVIDFNAIVAAKHLLPIVELSLGNTGKCFAPTAMMA